MASPEEVDALLRPIRGCTRSYAALGPVPAALADVGEPSARACALVQGIVTRFERSRTVADASRKTRLKLAAAALTEAQTELLTHFRLAAGIAPPGDSDALVHALDTLGYEAARGGSRRRPAGCGESGGAGLDALPRAGARRVVRRLPRRRAVGSRSLERLAVGGRPGEGEMYLAPYSAHMAPR